MEIGALATALRDQARATGAITLDGSLLTGAQLDAIRSAFGLPDGAVVTVSGVKAGDVPDPDPNGVVMIAAGTAPLLAQRAAAMAMSFTAPGGIVQAVIVATMPSKWAFADSFPGLDRFPFTAVGIADAQFAFATVNHPAYLPPTGVNGATDLFAGLNFLGQATFDALTVLTTLAHIPATSFKLHGPFAPALGQALPVGTLTAQLGSQSVSVGVAPDALSLAGPAVAVRIGAGTADDPVQRVDLLLEATFQAVLQVAIVIPESGDTLEVATTPLPNSGSITTLIEALPGGKDFSDFIPGELAAVFAEVGLQNFSMVVSSAPAVTYRSLAIDTLAQWTLIPDVLVLDSLALQVATVDPAGSDWTDVSIAGSGKFLPKIFPGTLDFTVGIEKDSAWEIATISGRYEGSVTLGDLVAGLSDSNVPAALADIAFADFEVVLTRSAAGQPFTYSFHGIVEAAFPILGQQLASRLIVSVAQQSGGHEIRLNGSLVVGEQSFSIALDLSAAGSSLSAEWTPLDGSLDFGDVAASLGWDGMPSIPESLDLELTVAHFVYDFTRDAIALGATASSGAIAFVSFVGGAEGAAPSKRAYVLDLDVALGVDLAELPVLGPSIPAALDVEIDSLQVLIANQDVGNDDLVEVSRLLDLISAPPIPSSGLAAGVTFAAQLQIGGTTHPLILPLSSPASGGALEAAAPEAPAAGESPAYSGPTKWFDLGKALGPVTVQRIGVQYLDSTLVFLVDASLAFGALQLSATGLGVGSPLTRFSPRFHLDGMTIGYVQGPLSISGGLATAQVTVGGETVTEYNGEALISTADWSVAALGSWATLDGHPSLFVFAALDTPIGGPPAFFITGLSAGFGYNRSLTLPTQDQVQSFPLVAGLSDPSLFGDGSPSAGLAALGDWVSPSPGANWAGAGVQFTSFELIHSNAFAVVELGDHFEIALLGLSRIKLPQTGPETYGYVELAIEIVIDPDGGLFSATSLITPNSYVLDPACHLTGGFAFEIWFGDNSHAGDFVLTVGGYHPLFSVPGWYPQEPRLGFDWQVSDQVTISGGAYFALTPSCVMGGGQLQVQFHSGDLAAWFIANGDFLIQWKPFYFQASVGISIGVSYRLNLLFVTTTIRVELGADLTLWGPPTGGNADIHLWIVSFSVSFGPSFGTGTAPLGWDEFRGLLPRDSAPAATRAAMLGDPPAELGNVCGIRVNRGLLPTQTEPGSWQVRADEFLFSVDTAFPLTELGLVGPAETRSLEPPRLDPPVADPPPGARSDGYFVGVRAMAIPIVVSKLTVTVTDLSEAPPLVLDLYSDWSWTLDLRAVAEAMWGQPIAPGDTPRPGAATLPGRLVGLAGIAPAIIAPTGPDAIPVANLSYDPIDPVDDRYLPFPRPAATNPPLPSATSLETIADTITKGDSAGSPVANRAAIFAGLQALGYDPVSNGDMSALAASVDLGFPSPPMLGSPFAASPSAGLLQ